MNLEYHPWMFLLLPAACISCGTCDRRGCDSEHWRLKSDNQNLPASVPNQPSDFTLHCWRRAEAAAAGNQKEREKYGVIVNSLAGRLLNPVKKEFNPYTS